MSEKVKEDVSVGDLLPVTRDGVEEMEEQVAVCVDTVADELCDPAEGVPDLVWVGLADSVKLTVSDSERGDQVLVGVGE